MTALTDFDGKRCPDFNPDNEFKKCQYYDPAGREQECGFCKNEKYYRCVAEIRRGIPLSYSSVSDFLTCHYLYYSKSIRGIRLRDNHLSPAIKNGLLWDAVRESLLGRNDVKIPDVINRYEIPPREVAKVRGIYRAYRELEIEVEPGYSLQHEIDDVLGFDGPQLILTGFYDRKYENYFVENKFSGRPDNYFDPFFIQSQVGVYFMADPKLEYCVMEVVRSPDLKSVGKNRDEEPEAYGERVFQDAISRPTHYFPGWDKKTRRYGKKFWRREFDLDSISDRFVHVFREIRAAWQNDAYYRNDRVCNAVLPGIQCDMLPICRTQGHLNDEVFEIRKRKPTF